MPFADFVKMQQSLIGEVGEGNAYLVCAIGLYLGHSNYSSLASEGLTDGPNDKKIDFIRLDRDEKRITFAQGFYSNANKASAPANKASDLKTACAWLISGDLANVPGQLKAVIQECRQALLEDEVSTIELLYVHNLTESLNATKELQTAAFHLQQHLQDRTIQVASKEMGAKYLDDLYRNSDSQILVRGEVACPVDEYMEQSGDGWDAIVFSIPGKWLHQLFKEHGDALFSANYRGFLGITKHKRINTGIRSSAETQPGNFWAYNNGISILTRARRPMKGGFLLEGISIINGAQTTGSIGSVDIQRNSLDDVRVLCRVIQASSPETIDKIIKFNNTQNEITTWDAYSNDIEQRRLVEEFQLLEYSYISKRTDQRGTGEEIWMDEVAQPLLAFVGSFAEANRSRNRIFERTAQYKAAFQNRKAAHVLLAYSLANAIDEIRTELKMASTAGHLTGPKAQQLGLLRNLKFKYFLVSLVAKCTETLLDRPVDLATLAFKPTVVQNPHVRFREMTALWVDVVKAVLGFAVVSLDTETFAKRSGEDQLLVEASSAVSAYLQALGRPFALTDAIS